MPDDKRAKTHRDLVPPDVCPALMMKHILTGDLDSTVFDDRDYPGDGYYWCTRTCEPVGPDDELVDPWRCRPLRRCYEGVTS